jgi:hypothetical protein
MNIQILPDFGILVLSEAVEQVAEPSCNLISVVDKGITDGSRVNAKEKHILRKVAGRQEWRRVVLILLSIKQCVLIDSQGNIVEAPCVVKDPVGIDRQIRRTKGIPIPHGGNYNGANDSTCST